MYRAQIFRLYPTPDQEAYFRRAVGVARFAWNWALALRERYYRRYGKWLSSFTLINKWSRHKQGKFAWAAEVGSRCQLFAIAQVEEGFKRLSLKIACRPKFKKKGKCRESFCAANSAATASRSLRVDGYVQIPIAGLVATNTPTRWPSSPIRRSTVYREADRWFVSVLFDLPDPKPQPHTGATAGIDLGCTTFATIASKGEVVDEIKPPKPYAKAKRKLKRLQRAVSRKKKDSANRRKATIRLARQHARVKNVRQDFLHKLTRRIVQTYSQIGMEDLCVKGLARSRLAGTIHDLGWGEFRRQLTYKAEETGTELRFADRFYPSSKTCHRCGTIKDKLPLKERLFRCVCGVVIDRDHNAAINLEKIPRGSGESTPAEIGGSGGRKTSRCRSKKRELKSSAS